MDLPMGNENENGGASGDEQEASNSRKRGKTYHRHTSQQIQHLEAFFKKCPHPDDNQRRQLSKELRLEPQQIKFWFQNKRTQTKTQTERADNSTLRAENSRIQCENYAIKEALKNVICPACGGPPFGEQDRQKSLQKLHLENAQLKEEHDKVATLLSKFIGKPLSQIDSLTYAARSSLDVSPGLLINQAMRSSDLSHEFINPTISNNAALAYYQVNAIPETEKTVMIETAASAMEELIRILRINEPMWIKSNSDGRYVLNHENYDKMFPRAYRLKTSSARIESSKDSGIASISALQLVDTFLDANKWVGLFPTIVTKAKTIEVLQAGMFGTQSGCLQLMYGQMHILSPLVLPRDFYFLRFCQQIEVGTWVIVDVSYDCFKESTTQRSWRLPSGCMIQDMPNGCSKVTWVEHVEVDDKTQTHRLYRDLVCGIVAYGAQRWIVTLQRMCERFGCSFDDVSSSSEFGAMFAMPEGRSSIMKLSHRMVKNFCGMLSMSGKLDFPQLSEVNNSGVRVNVRKSIEPGEPSGMVVAAATSLWLPLHSQDVFNFFTNEKTRVQWDVLSNGNPMNVIAHIPTGAHPGNCISIIQPFVPTEGNMLLLQESYIDTLGSMVIYAPVEVATINIAVGGDVDSSDIPILPSGFVISDDGRPDTGTSSSTNPARSGGSLLTVAFQILVPFPSPSQVLNVESVATVNTLISLTVQKIKTALNCAGLD
ncbi:homeobox-leucine zipper protein HDG11-like [Rosa rugosa]|uniref:homeobox-leucine zipper protein HDG11-like n=1 Tax=Rosa rugosa TaxID=74645 RepID=UPI002B413671|nr:homeobox-leucine zipper protein HDG11-like [Rosa rugosa]